MLAAAKGEGMTKKFNLLILSATCLALLVVALGAYTRLSNAGLGCPDWPGCYGFLTVPNSASELAQAKALFPSSTVEPVKAWIEMVHRYFASLLGFLIILLLVFGVAKKQRHIPNNLISLLLVLVLFQGGLGMLTVTMNLQPVIVMGHLLGGFTILSLLMILCFYAFTPAYIQVAYAGHSLKRLSFIATSVLIIQIALGGWVAANYAAPHCVGLPMCENLHLFSWQSLLELPVGEENYEYGVLPFETRLSIHMLHRGWAIVTVITLLFWVWKIISHSDSAYLKQAATLVTVLLIIQVGLGAAIVHWQFPLPLTLFHNVMAALLLLSCLFICFLICNRCKEQPHG